MRGEIEARFRSNLGRVRALLRDVHMVTAGKPKPKITLADLLHHRGTTVDDVIRRSIEAHLALSNFNNVGERSRPP